LKKKSRVLKTLLLNKIIALEANIKPILHVLFLLFDITFLK